MRTNLNVPFAEKDAAKKLGARWDGTKKLWYIENVNDLVPFSKWLDSPTVDIDSGAPVPKNSVAKKSDSSAGITTVGSTYKAVPLVCDCPPWEVCDKCLPMALNS